MYEIYANNQLIPNSDVISISQFPDEKLKFDFKNMVSQKISVDVNNIDKSKYDDTYQGSLFYQSSWYNASFKIVDTRYNLTIWNGRIKNIKRDEGKKKLTIESTNYVKDIIDTTCIISAGSLSNITPAEIIYSILKDVVLIPESSINKTSFDNAKAIQSANSGYMIVNYTAENNVKCSDVINEILRITSSYVYTINNIIYYSQVSPYTNRQNLLVDESSIISGTYTDEYNYENVLNDYKIAYKSSDTVVSFAVPGTSPSYITLSKSKYGTRFFTVPDDDQKSTTPSNYRVLLKSLASATYYGGLVLSLNHYAKKIAKFNISKDLTNVYLNTFIDVNFNNLVREPMRTIERKINNKDITITAEMLNFPYESVERDKIKPESVQLTNVKHFINNKIQLQWTQSEDAGFSAYQIEFSTSPTDFTDCYSAEGYSPIIIEEPEIIDGLCSFKLSDFFDTAKYYFRIKVIDTAGNISEPSNVLTLDVHYIENPGIEPQYYHCEGDLLTGVYFKDGVGTPPSGFTTYGDDYYGDVVYTYSAFYQSDIISNSEGFKNIKFITNQLTDYYDVQYRTYNNGLYGEWNNLNSIIINNQYGFETNIESEPTQIQIKVLFKLPYLYGTFNIKLYLVN